jgi:hypothetical protein
VHPLVAQPEGRGHLAQRTAVQMQPADRTVKLGPGHLGVVFRLDQPFLGLAGLGQQTLIHIV